MTPPPTDYRRALWLRLWAELGAAPITEAYLVAKDAQVDGVCVGRDIVINPSHQTVDTVVHELLHRMFPTRSERSIRRTVTTLRNILSDDEIQLFSAEYLRRKKPGRPRRADLAD